MDKVYYNCTIINEGKVFEGSMRVNSSGRIVSVAEGLLPADDAERIDLKGAYLIPGAIDSHVHFREPGLEHKATIFSESRAAAAGGVTSFMEMPNTNPATTTLEALNDKRARAAKDSVVNYAFYIGATRDNLPLLRDMDYTHVPGIKLFMGSSTGGMLVDNEEALREIFSLPRLIAVHCEDELTIRNNMSAISAQYPELSDAPISWHPEIRSAIACYLSTHKAVSLAKTLGTRLHVMHLSTAQELALFSKDNPKITAEACVAHLHFCDNDYARLGSFIKCNPAIKSSVHREALRSAIRDGLISTISTDHAPHTLQEKEKGTLTAPSGMPMVQFSLPLMLHYALSEQWIDLPKVAEMMCHNQADIFGVKDRGYLRKGYMADFVTFEKISTPRAIAKDEIISSCGWSPLEKQGTRLSVRITGTYVNGRQVYNAAAPRQFATGAAQELEFCTD